MGRALAGRDQASAQVILEDKLDICAELEAQVQELVRTFFCEWTQTINDPERRKAFQQFANTEEDMEPAIEKVEERGHLSRRIGRRSQLMTISRGRNGAS